MILWLKENHFEDGKIAKDPRLNFIWDSWAKQNIKICKFYFVENFTAKVPEKHFLIFLEFILCW